MNKRYRTLRDKTDETMKAVEKEFNRLKRAYDAYMRAMQYRKESAALNGETVCGHSADVSNSHQSEIDNLRKEAAVFAEKVGGYGYRAAYVEAMSAFNRTIDQVEQDALI